ncbi:nitrate reductase delta subunit [Evansella caseinilytica]|uniref:Nitrate reductase delta subunit n=1 Tax=Evansella caseinilytica TaxID=1503961 RepID=A0A1H3SYD0_9BACI|nr:nitrate reductase molybdenum cofactor assembly chaperone [Evansella caseinilytica]SDZ42992.1 nitrate reductase delta subunit [Evansella caseinilytica]
MDKTLYLFKLLSVLLQYPTCYLREIALLKEELTGMLTAEDVVVKKHLDTFFAYVESGNAEDICEEYVQTFDVAEKTTLYLTYPMYGDERERGETLVKLKAMYRDSDCFIKGEELPDYLPLILEYVSVAPQEGAGKVLKLFKKPIHQLQLELESQNSPFAAVIELVKYLLNQWQATEKAS